MKFHIIFVRFALKMQFIYDYSHFKGENVQEIAFHDFWVILWTNSVVQNTITFHWKQLLI